MFLRKALQTQSRLISNSAQLQRSLNFAPVFKFSDSVDPNSIYARIGGQPSMDACVPLFYDKVLADPTVNFFFKNTDMELQKKRQNQFLTMAFGGPNHYEGTDMVTAHKGMNITEEQYQSIVTHLGTTLGELGVSADIIGEIVEIAEAVKGDIVGQ